MSLLLLMGGSAPNVASLFANNEAGLALDVEAAYLRGWVYQDSAGATVAAAAGDPVGLILDTAKGGLDQLGSDLVSNGTFASDTVWTKGANWTIGSGVATKTGGAANNLTQTISSTAGLWYRITMDVTRTAGTLTVSLGTSGTTYAMSASGSYTFYILAGSSTQTLTLAGDSSFAGTVDNVTARLVPGSHAYQTTSGSRPLLARTPDGGRRNVLTYSEQFDNAAWTKSATTISANATTAPDGTLTADSYVDTAVADDHVLYNSFQTTTTATFSVYAKANGKTNVSLRAFSNANETYVAVFDLSNGTKGLDVETGTTFSGVSAAISSVGNGWYRCSITYTRSSGITYHAIDLVTSSNPTLGSNGSQGYLGDGTGIFIWGAQVETGSSATAYQKVGLTSDVTESGKRDCWGLLFDGSDDSLASSAIDFSGTDKMVVMAGVRKLSDAAAGTIASLGTYVSGNTFELQAPPSVLQKYQWAIHGNGANTTDDDFNVYRFAGIAPTTNVITATADRSIANTSGVSARNNGVIATRETTTVTGSNISGNFANAILYIGRRGGSTLPFNGLLYSLIIRGATTPTGTIADFEKNLLARRAGTSW